MVEQQKQSVVEQNGPVGWYSKENALLIAFPLKFVNEILKQVAMISTLAIFLNNTFCISPRKQFSGGIKSVVKGSFSLLYMRVWLQWVLINKSFVGATDVLKMYGISPGGVDQSSSVATYGNFTIFGLGYDHETSYDSGKAYIFDHNSNQFSNLSPNDGDPYGFGESVAICDNIAVVGSPYDDSGISFNSGSVYIFQYNMEMRSWNQTAKLTASDAGAYHYFGNSVGISTATYNNHYHVIVGTGTRNNKAYIFQYNSSNRMWSQHSIFRQNDTQDYYHFGVSVAVNGKFAIVGSNSDDHASFIYRYNKLNDSWTELTKLNTSINDSVACDTSVAIYNGTVVVGAAECSDGGSAYVFKYNQANESWIENTKLETSDSSNSHFGQSVDIFEDLIIVGGESYASVFKYNEMNNTWDELKQLIGTDFKPYNFFGYPVAISDSFAAVGCHTPHNYPIYIAHMEDLQRDRLTLKVEYNYETSVDIVNIETNDTYFSSSIDECNSVEELRDTTSWALPTSGCYSITFNDCDDSVVNDRTNNHGSYEIEVYGVLAGIGGFYLNSETSIICTNDIYNHVSFCITPGFCMNNQQLWTNNGSEITMSSFEALVRSTITLNHTHEIYIDCSGDKSCYNSIFKVSDVCFVLQLTFTILFLACQIGLHIFGHRQSDLFLFL